MREHLYRGKRKDNGEWVYGSLISLTQGEFIVTTDYYNTVNIDLHEKLLCNALWEDNDFVKVLPNTIGEYTGLTDKNGNKIFEGDIIRFAEWSRGEPCWIGEIYFQNTMFQIKGGKNKECESNFIMQLSRIPSERIEIIGNIFDNPELLP